MKKIKYFIYAAIIYLCICGESPAMEMMSDNEMGSIVGQSGVDITIPGCEFTVYFDQFAINDSTGYLVANGPLDYILRTTATQTLVNQINYGTIDTNYKYNTLNEFGTFVTSVDTKYDDTYYVSNYTNVVNNYVSRVQNSLEEHEHGWLIKSYTYTFTDSTRNILSEAGLSSSQIDSLQYDYDDDGNASTHEYDERSDAGNASKSNIQSATAQRYNSNKNDYVSSVIESCFRKSDPLQATFAQYILGSKKGGIDFGSGRTYKDIDDYIDNKYGDNNYTTPSFKPLSIDVVKDPVKGKYIHLGLPTMQLMAKDLSNMSLGISNSANISLYPLISINVPGLVFEGHGGSVNLYPHTGGGFDIEFDATKFYYFNQSMIIGDSSWDGNPASNEHNIQFNDFLIHSGGWDAYGNRSNSFYHPFEFNGTISCDIETEADGKTWLKLDMPTNSGKVYATLGQMKICGEDFGTLEAGQFRILDDFKLWVSGHNNTGFDAMLSLALESDELKYTYGPGASDYNNAEGLHISNTFTTTTVTGGDSNKKTWHQEDGDPSKWVYTGTLNLGGPVTVTDWDSTSDNASWPNGSITLNQPLTVDIETDKIVATTTIDGSLGIENVQLGGKSFGPILATGIKGWAKITLHNK